MNTTQVLPAPRPYRLWRISLETLASADDIGLLSPEERDKAGRFKFERDRRRYLAAHVALRKTLAQCVASSPAMLRFEIGRYGKPALVQAAPCAFNLSHSQDVAVIAVAPHGQIGADVEMLRPVPDAVALAERNFTPAECGQLLALKGPERDAAFLRCWTRKEACLKAIGSGFSIAPQLFEAGAVAGRKQVVVPTDDGSVHLIVESLPEGDGLLVALARIVDATSTDLQGAWRTGSSRRR